MRMEGPVRGVPHHGLPEMSDQARTLDDTKHTRGPWTAPMGQFDFTNAGERPILFGKPEDEFYGRVALAMPREDRKARGKNATPYNAPDAERDANARLIAAAPDMLAVLQMLFSCEISDSDYQARVMDRARDAVNKALGIK